MPFCISRRWPVRQLIAASSLILLVACAEKPTAADAKPLQTLPVATAPAVIPPVVPTGENLDIQPTQLHERVSVILGSKNEVERVTSYHSTL